MTNNQYRKRQSNLYISGQAQPFVISRSKIDMFLNCPRCFYMDRKLGLPKPSIPAFTLNSATDNLFKNEFDIFREKGEPHPLMKKYKIDAVPFKHPDVPLWRGEVNRYSGAKVLHKETNLIIDGLIDDVWINKQNELLIVDYKSTCTERKINLNDKWKQGYKRQMEIYQWIFKKLGFKTSNTGYFVYANADKNKPKFDAKLEFDIEIIPYKGHTEWVEPLLFKIKKCLESDTIPKIGVDDQGIPCEYCTYKKLSAQTVAKLGKSKLANLPA